MRNRTLLFGFILAICFLSASCDKKGKDNPVPVKDGFAVGDRRFDSLNDAIHAALHSSDHDNTVRLEKDVTDDAVLNIGGDEYGEVTIDFGRHIYTSIAVGGLDFGGLDVEMLSEGGALFCEKGAISSTSSLFVSPDFNGRINANIILDNALMQIASYDVEMNIPELSVSGEGRFEVVEKPVKDASIVIDKLISDCKYPVGASDAAGIVINKGGKVHVHNYKSVDVSPACQTVHEFYNVCEECGYAVPGEIEEGESGPCDPANLVYHPYVEPTDREFGNVEYWECPDCGRVFVDAEGKIPAEEGLFLMADDYLAGAEFLKEYEAEFGTGENENSPWDAVSCIFTVLKFPIDIANQFAQTDLLNTISVQLSNMSKNITAIQGMLNDLLKKMQTDSYRNELGNRINACVAFSGYNDSYYDQHINNLKNKASEEVINTNLQEWWNRGGLDVTNTVQTLLKQYCKSSYFPGSIPDVQEKLTQNTFGWEHQGYEFRNNLTKNEFARISRPYFLALTYLRNVSTSPAERSRADSLVNDMKRCLEVCRRDSTRMAERNEKYRIYCLDGESQLAVYSRNDTPEGGRFLKWFENQANLNKNYFPYDNGNDVAVRSCNQLLCDIGFVDQQGRGKLLERQHIEKSLYFFGEKKGARNFYQNWSVRDFLMNEIGFSNLAEPKGDNQNAEYLFGNSYDVNYSKFIRKEEYILPPFLSMSRLYYKHVHFFVNSKISKNNDHFWLENIAIRPASNCSDIMNHKYKCYDPRFDMNIKSSNGKITGIGKPGTLSYSRGYYITRLYDVN